MPRGKSVRIYLADGTVTGVRHAEIVNWTGQGIACPRNKVRELSKPDWGAARQPGVYFLFGLSETSDKTCAYIGEAENVLKRLENHMANKDFWNEVIFFTNKDENLTKAHVKFLESKLIAKALQVNRYDIENGNQPGLPLLPRSDRDAMEDFLDYIRLLLGVLGHKILEPLIKRPVKIPAPSAMEHKPLKKAQAPPQPSPEESGEYLKLKTAPKKDSFGLGVQSSAEDAFMVKAELLEEEESAESEAGYEEEIKLFMEIKGIKAEAIQTDEGIVVLKNSLALTRFSDTLRGYKKLKEKLLKDKILVSKGDNLIFTRDYLFSSPSAAAAVIAGQPMNGRTSWKNATGKTLKELEETEQT